MTNNNSKATLQAIVKTTPSFRKSKINGILNKLTDSELALLRTAIDWQLRKNGGQPNIRLGDIEISAQQAERILKQSSKIVSQRIRAIIRREVKMGRMHKSALSLYR